MVIYDSEVVNFRRKSRHLAGWVQDEQRGIQGHREDPEGLGLSHREVSFKPLFGQHTRHSNFFEISHLTSLATPGSDTGALSCPREPPIWSFTTSRGVSADVSADVSGDVSGDVAQATSSPFPPPHGATSCAQLAWANSLEWPV